MAENKISGGIILKRVLALILCCTVLMCFTPGKHVLADDANDDEPIVGVFTKADNGAPKDQLPKIDAVAAIVLDMSSGRVLYEKNAYSRRPMASTTKIMTAIVAIENGNLNDVVTVSKRAAAIGGSTIDLKQGQKYTLRELLYGLMLKSGNDAAIAIAEHIGGSVEGFVEMMNRKAADLGAKDTSFRSPHGLDAPEHYSSAYDLAIITKYALANKTFSRIVGTIEASIPNKALHNTNEMLELYPGADGVKTGYTGMAGRCLVTSATRNNWRIISVVLNCPTRTKRAQSSKSILDYAFDNYKSYTLLKAGENIKDIPVIKGMAGKVRVEAVEGIRLPLRKDEADNLQKVVELPDSLMAPVYTNVEVGTIKYMVNGKVIAESGLKTSEDVRKKEFFDYFGDIFREWGRLMRFAN